MSNTLDEILAPWVGFVHSEYDGTSMVDDELAVIATAKQQLLDEVLDMIPKKYHIAPSLESVVVMIAYYSNQGRNEAIDEMIKLAKERFK